MEKLWSSPLFFTIMEVLLQVSEMENPGYEQVSSPT